MNEPNVSIVMGLNTETVKSLIAIERDEATTSERLAAVKYLMSLARDLRINPTGDRLEDAAIRGTAMAIEVSAGFLLDGKHVNGGDE